MAKAKAVVKGLKNLGELLGGTTAERMARAAEQGFDTNKTWYHGTTRWDDGETQFGNIDAFDRQFTKKALGRNKTVDQVGSWFSDTPSTQGAGQYTGDNGVIYPVNLAVKNPWKPREGFKTMKRIAAKLSGVDPDNITRPLDSEPLRQWLLDGGYDGIAFPRGTVDGTDQSVMVALHPEDIRSVNADFNPANRDSPNLLASLAIPVAAGLAGTAALAPQEAEAGMLDPQYQQDAMEAYSAAQGFAQRRASKADHWKALRQEVIDLANSVGDFTSNTVFPALDKPLQGYMGISAVAGTLASGGGFNEALQQGGRIASQPTDQTAYQYGQTVTDTLNPYLPNEVAAGAGALTNAGVLLGSPL